MFFVVEESVTQISVHSYHMVCFESRILLLLIASVKTFAFIEVLMSDKSFQRCVATYKKAKWKGEAITIQLAKENFLDRLKRERVEMVEKTQRDTATQLDGDRKLESKGYQFFEKSRIRRKRDIRAKCHKKLEIDDVEKPVSNLTWNFDGCDVIGAVKDVLSGCGGGMGEGDGDSREEGGSDHWRKDVNHNGGNGRKDDGDSESEDDTDQNVEESKVPAVRSLLAGNDDANYLPIMTSLMGRKESGAEPHDSLVESDSRESKRIKSEERRRQALDEMLLRSKQLRISLDSKPNVRHIIFDSDNSDESIRSNDHVAGEIVEEVKGSSKSGSVASSKSHLMQLFTDSSDSEEEDIKKHFKQKPQFEGRVGEKLFKLQQRIGGDKRFQLDERFHSDESNSEEVESTDNEDKLFSKQITEERNMALGIADQLLGIKTHASVDEDTAYNDLDLFQPLRYDPESESCRDLELNESISKHVVEKDVEMDKRSPSESKDVECGIHADNQMCTKERYYSVHGDLKKAFSGGNEEQPGEFKLGSLFKDSTSADKPNSLPPTNNHGTKELVQVENTLGRLMGLQEEDTSTSGEELQCTKPSLLDQPPSSSTTLFFFHPRTDLRNRLSTQFKRQTSLEELNNKWPDLRKRFKQSFRQRRKDVLRSRKRKLDG